MHALTIPSWYPTSPKDVHGIFFRQQVRALHRAGVNMGVIAPVFRSLRGEPASVFTGGYGIRSTLDEGVPTYLYKSMFFFPRTRIDRSLWVKAGLKLFQTYVRRHGRPDVLHAHCMNYGGILAHRIHTETGIPYVITEHSTTYARKLVHDWQWAAMHEAAEQCSSRIAVSRDFQQLLEQEYRGLEWKYIPNILTDRFEAPVDLAAKPHNADFTFCSVAHLQHKKGFDILLPAFADALKKYPQLKLVIGGTGPQEGRLHQLAAGLNLGGSVTFLGALDSQAVLDLMYRSDAFVLPSRHETFGVVFIEALSQGLPVIATRCGGPESIVTPDNGLLIPTENQAALTDALISLYENHREYRAENLRARCLEEFGKNSITAQLTAEYRQAIAAAPAQSGSFRP